MSKIGAIVTTIMLCLPALTLLAQNPPSGSGGSGAPIDGGISALLIGSAIIGYRKMKKEKQEKA